MVGKMRILILSPNYSHRVNWCHQHLRDELLRLNPSSIQYGEKCKYFGKTHVPDILKEFGSFDLILLENQKNMQIYTGLDEIDCVKAIYLGDYFPDGRSNMPKYNDLINRHRIDLALCPTPTVRKLFWQQRHKGKVRKECVGILLPYSADTNIFKPRPELQKKYDVMAVFGLVSYIYPLRPAVQSTIDQHFPNSLIGDWKTGPKHMEYAKAINQSKIFVNSNGINKQVLMKYYECMASGTLLLTDKAENFEFFGFEPGFNMAVYKDARDLVEKIKYYLEHGEERETIAREGRRLIESEHSCSIRAIQLLNCVDSYLYDKQRGKYAEPTQSFNSTKADYPRGSETWCGFIGE